MPLIAEPGLFRRRSREGPSLPGDPEPGGGRRRHRLAWVLGAIAALLVALGALGAIVRLPYYTLAPGDALDVNGLVSVSGAKTYEPDGHVLLLFVRERARVNAWQWLQASLDPDIDLFEEEAFTGGESPAELRAGARADMARSQISAKKVALERLGYRVRPAGRGIVVLALLPGKPAEELLREDDVIVAADDRPIISSDDLGKAVQTHAVGEEIRLRIRRDGRLRTVEVETAADDDGEAVIGVYVVRPYVFPVDITIDTSNIGGPSAGLAMALSIIDELSPGDLTGGLSVAVTGVIGEDGVVGEVGGVGQKAVAARASGADLMLVPRAEVGEARERAGDLTVVGVDDLDDALRALTASGGDSLPAQERRQAA